jgi:hypothetical protein
MKKEILEVLRSKNSSITEKKLRKAVFKLRETEKDDDGNDNKERKSARKVAFVESLVALEKKRKICRDEESGSIRLTERSKSNTVASSTEDEPRKNRPRYGSYYGIEKCLLPDMIDDYKSFSPKLDKELTAILKGMASATVEDLDNGVRAIRLGDGARIGDMISGGTLYERLFYPQLVSKIRTARRRVCLISNPGTGKSTFQYYLLARYVKPSLFNDEPLNGPIRFGTDSPPEVVIRHIPQDGIEIWFLE